MSKVKQKKRGRAPPALDLEIEGPRSPGEISGRVAAIRAYWGLTQKAFGSKVGGVSQGSVSAWESGDPSYTIGVAAANRICDKFGVTLDFVFRGDHRAITDRSMVRKMFGGKEPE
jgi:DNA-binding XRE family transcriptional regulator